MLYPIPAAEPCQGELKKVCSNGFLEVIEGQGCVPGAAINMPAPKDAIAEQSAIERSGKTSTGVGNLIIPPVPYLPLPPAIAVRFPELEQWNRSQYNAMMEWRERTNSVFSRLPESPVADPTPPP
jgi:hypothetical protein